MRKGFTLMVMGATALSSVLSTAAWADTIPDPVAAAADGDTLQAMEDQCDLLAANHDMDDGDEWSATVVPGLIERVSGPTEVDGTRVIDESTIQHDPNSQYTPSELEIRGDPFRIGGSVNMFGDQWSTAGQWANSTYYYNADFDSTFRHHFTCDIYQRVYAEGDPTQGYYTIDPELIGSPQAGAILQACNAFNDAHEKGIEQGFWGTSPQGNCVFVGTAVPTLGPPTLVGNEDGGYVDQDQTDIGVRAFENEGGPVDADEGELYMGHPVVCISPKKPAPGGTWQQQNGYTGNKCTTDWFKVAPTNYGTMYSQGTYISVPNYTYP